MRTKRKASEQSTIDIEPGYYWVIFNNLKERRIMRWTGKQWDAFSSDDPVFEFVLSFRRIDTPPVEDLVSKEILGHMRSSNQSQP